MRPHSSRPPARGSTFADTIEAYVELSYKEARGAILHEFEQVYLQRLLESCKGNVAEAARRARMDRSHLYSLLKRHKLRSSR